MLLRLPELAVAHGFTTRAGGVSTGALSSLNLARRPGETDAALRENWQRAVDALGVGASTAQVALLHQVHGAGVARVESGCGVLAVAATADGAVTCEPEVVLAVRTADCVPVLLAAPGAVGVAHAGWRGLVAGVLEATVAALCESSGCPPGDVVAGIGPHIQVDAYEVGDEVVDGIRARGLDPVTFTVMGRRGRPHVDLGVAAEALLRASGVGRVASVKRCTSADSAFYSHRRDGAATGRQAGLITLGAP